MGRRKKPKTQSGLLLDTAPLITIAICTYNRAGYLEDTLADIACQNADSSFVEVLVINNNCTDHTEQVCSSFAENHPEITFTMVHEEKQGLSYARNRAVEESRAGTILYIDDDVILPQNFIQQVVAYHRRHPEMMCCGGRILVSFDDGEPDWIPRELMPMFGLHDLGETDRIYPPGNFPRGGCMMIRKEVFEKNGVFQTDLGRIGSSLLGSEEKEFFDRVRSRGVKLHYRPGLMLWHRIGSGRLSRSYIRNQSLGIGASERLRVSGSVSKTTLKLGSELFKFAASLILAAGYLIRGKRKAAGFLLLFRKWVLQGFFDQQND